MQQLETFEKRLQIQIANPQDRSRNASFHSNPRGSVAGHTSSLHLNSASKPSFLTEKTASQPSTPLIANAHYAGRKPASFIRNQQHPSEEPIKKYKQQKNLENIWFQSLVSKGATDSKLNPQDKMDEVKLAIQKFGSKNVFNSDQKSQSAMNSFRSSKGRSLGAIKF